MGICCGTPLDQQNRDVQRDLDKSSRVDQREIKLLLLGAGGSGKSTLFKQLQYIHGKGYTERDRLLYSKQIHEQLIESMRILVTRCEEYWDRDPELYAQYKLYDYALDHDEDPTRGTAGGDAGNGITDDLIGEDMKLKNAADAILSGGSNRKLTGELVHSLKVLWANKVIKAMYAIRNEICVPDSSQYFFDAIDRVTADDYIPTDTDLLMVRYRTTGVQTQHFVVRNHRFKICDVGGQRNERRKWIHYFNNVTSVIFVVSLSCYDEITFEDENNAMTISLQVFSEQVNSEWFTDIPFILFLNKSDLFFEKVAMVRISVSPSFSSYSGPCNDAHSALSHIKEVFNSANSNPGREVFTHVTCATNKDQVEKVFNDVQTMIINWSLARAGLT